MNESTETRCTTLKGAQIPEDWQGKDKLVGIQYYPFVTKDGGVDESRSEVMTMHHSENGIAETAFYVLPMGYADVHALSVLGISPLDNDNFHNADLKAMGVVREAGKHKRKEEENE
ncbi:hypothetical protein KS4_23180 [Poriferisphaera corsica]|uniref:Uncharacterized protein n=1 Tax=Poriferisphaera corsica TaxID=2528020 RepID=A0A517YVP0_9BACT|nr:hypothetical protein [Poriferisphaera corsica]QDU34252.1 hypothetical protein KS4_23180 [Poriferisphaera corsica]